MNCTVTEAKRKICIPLSKTMCIEKNCTGDQCMSWAWDFTEEFNEQALFRCPECGIISPEQSTCHSKVMEQVATDPDKLTGFCMEAGK